MKRTGESGGKKAKPDRTRCGVLLMCIPMKGIYRDIADVWKRTSLQMKVLSEANGAKYYHFLQPNQGRCRFEAHEGGGEEAGHQ